MKRMLALLLVLLCLPLGALAAPGLTDFSAVDMNGNTVTQSVFADYELTMVNVWASWCGFCINEMPYLAQIKTLLPDNLNLISICEDAGASPDAAAQVLSDAGADFTTLVGNESLDAALLGFVSAFPTTFFVDAAGRIVGEPIIGVPTLEPDQTIDAYRTRFKAAYDLL